jgi:hypothetical protein
MSVSIQNKIRRLKNKYAGERVFVIGNGPSLRQTPLHRLYDEYTIGMNKINKIYSDTDWRPSFYYVSQSENYIDAPHRGGNDYIKENVELGITCFLRTEFSNYTGNDVYHINIFNLEAVRLFDKMTRKDIDRLSIDFIKNFWSDDASEFIYHYHTMYGVLQLIDYLGFDEIYIVGADLGFEYIKPHMVFEGGMDPHRYDGNMLSYIQDSINGGSAVRSLINGVAHQLIRNIIFKELLSSFMSNTNEHFTDDYEEKVRIHDGPRVNREISKSHKIARKIFNSKNTNIYNATRGGELDVYDRKKLDRIL